MDKKLILAVVLSIAVLIGFNAYFASQTEKHKPVTPVSEPPSSTQQAQKETEKPGEPLVEVQKSRETIKTTSKRTKFEGKEIEVNTDLLKVVFTTKGAKIKNWILKDYQVQKGELIDLAGGLNIYMGGFDSCEFNPVGTVDLTKDGAKEGKISFVFNSNDIRITKEFLFKKNKYSVDCSVRVDNTGKKEAKVDNFIVSWGPGLGTPEKLSEFEELTAYSYIDEKVKKDKTNKIKGEVANKGNISWLAMSKKFFVAAIIPQKTYASSSIITREFIKGKEGDIPTSVASLKMPDLKIAAGSSQITSFTVYVGPSILENLKELKIHKVLDFGWFSGLGVLLLVILKFFYRLVHNYGLAIILLTILIKAILWWPTAKSMKSMKAMQKLQPQMTVLRERHKNNPQQLNQEVLKLYKTQKVNPLGGCLPMILQIPIFYALYMLLVNAVELRGEPFYFWIKDLSVKDPYYIVPVVMGITMFIQQKMTPTPDPSQAKIMLILPVVFTFMFINLPAGVVLYWTFQNILSIAQQFSINKQ